jgi:predicted alpha-1,2-mannosidase
MATTAQPPPKVKEPVDYVNPFIGASTDAEKAGVSHGLGKTFPGATTPFGMVQVSPNTITGGDNGSGYSYEHTSIEGFAFTQLSGVGWYGDLGNFLVMPTTGPLHTNAGPATGAAPTKAAGAAATTAGATGAGAAAPAGGYRSPYDKSTEKAGAGYYSVFLTKYQVKTECTAAPHSGMLRFTYDKGGPARIQIDLARRVGGTSTLQEVHVVDERSIEGWMQCTPAGGGWGDGDGHVSYTVYFRAEFSKPLKDFGVWSAAIPDNWTRKREDVESGRYQQCIAAAAVTKNVRDLQGKHLGFFTEFNARPGEQVTMKVGISFVDIEGARNNLQHEIPGWDFDAVHRQAVAGWSRALDKIKISGGTEEEKTVFYTALYHTLIDPRVLTDVDGRYPGGDDQIHKPAMYTRRTVFSGWDVYRSQMPLQTIINPSVVNDMINSLIDLAGESGRQYLERWELMNAYTGCMIGNPAVIMIADAYAKGIRNFDLTRAYRYSVNTCERYGNGDRGWAYICDPDDHSGTSYASAPFVISNTLEDGYSEWCLSRLAAALGHHNDSVRYANRGESYRNIFDDSVGWFRPRKADGSWEPWPAEGRLKQFYGTVESNPYQQGWFVPHDIPGMVALMGGREKVIADLQNMFHKTPGNMLWNDYYNHANEPVHHVPFLFNRLGAPWLTQEWTRQICTRAYHNGVEGLVGNEDVGQMSAWYVLAASGFHPVCPGDTRYEITSPVFSRVVIQLDGAYASGKTFTIIARDNSRENIYIQSATLNGKPYPYCHIDHAQITAGGILELLMGPRPNKNWGI